MATKPLPVCLAFLAVTAPSSRGQTPPPTAAISYLQQASDRYQHTVDVYTDADAAGNHFPARGAFASPGGLALVPTMDEISPNAPCMGITCITASLNLNGSNWGGWYFMNGVLGPTDRQPSPNWGDQPNAGFDLTGATQLQFWARGLNGGEKVEFFCFGVGYDPSNGAQVAPYPDSSRKVSLGTVSLSTTWTKYQISLAGIDMHYVLGGFGWVAQAQGQTNPMQSITFYVDNIQYVKDRPTDPRFLVSYETIKSNNSFDAVERNAAFAYDNAVALIAFIAAGDLVHARTIADAMVYAQLNDRFFTDGRLRNANQGADIKLLPGWLPNNKPNTARMPGWFDAVQKMWFEDETQVSSNTGNIAWAMLGLLHFYETTQEQKYLQAVDALGNWVIANTSDTRGSGGFTGGYDGWENQAASGGSTNCATSIFVNGQCKRLYKSTEHNIDLYAAFSRLNLIEKQAQWAEAALQAKTFVLSMWDPTGGKFWTGTDEGGVNASTSVIPADIQAWAIQALGSDAVPYLSALTYVESHHKTTLGYGFKQDGGNSCGDNTWFEGTSQIALAYLLAGNPSKWQSILNDVHSAQITSGAVPATDGQCLNTGFTLNNGQPWEYFPRAHVGATGWLRLAEAVVNPFRSELYAPADFSISATSANLTTRLGTPVTDVLTFQPKGGVSTNISVSCSVQGGPPQASCSVSPNSVIPGASPVTSTLTFTAPTVSASLPFSLSRNRLTSASVVWLSLFALVLLGTGFSFRNKPARARTAWFSCSVAFVFAALALGCGGGNSGGGKPPGPITYTVTVTGTSGSLQHSTTVTVTAQ
jgi:hypothetical protein